MNENTCEIIVYTQNGALSFDVVATCEDFEDRLAASLEEGTVLLDTADENKLVLCAINVVAIEICTSGNSVRKVEGTPPVEKI